MSAKESGSFAPLSSHARLAQRLMGARRYAKGRLQTTSVRRLWPPSFALANFVTSFFIVWKQNDNKATIGRQFRRRGHIST
jgi:hypothetical protein